MNERGKMSKKSGTFFLLAISTILVASDSPDSFPLSQREESQAKQKQMEPKEFTSQPKNMLTPAVAPAVKNGVDFFVNTSFIYWNLGLVGPSTEYGLSGTFPGTVTTGTVVAPGKFYHANSAWEPGFKIGAGLEFEHDGWDLYAEWSWLNPVDRTWKAHGSLPQIAKNEILVALFGPCCGHGMSNSDNLLLSENLQYHFNAIDVELGRNFFFSKYMTMRPNVGLKTMWLWQKTKRIAHCTVASEPSSPTATWDFLTEKDNSWGIGVRAGADAVWHLSKSWGFYGDFAFSALSTWVKNFNYEVMNVNGLGNPTVVRDNKRNLFVMLPVFEVGVGFEYMTWFCDEAYMFNIKAGWEDQFMLPTVASSYTTPGYNYGLTELALQGLTLELGLHF
jgi:hypothetical protein